MARLEGKQSNAGISVVLLLIILIIVAVLALQYLGYVHWIPNFGLGMMGL